MSDRVRSIAEGAAEQANLKLQREREANPPWGTPERPANVAICMPIYDHVKVLTSRAMNQMWKAHKQEGSPIYGRTHVLDTWSIGVEAARVQLTATVMAVPDITHVLFVDADMTFPPESLQRLLAHDVPIVGGLCFNRRHPYNPILLRYHQEELERLGRQAQPYTGNEKKTFGFLYHYPKDALIEVDATGAAFLLIKREVFEKIADLPGHKADQENGKPWWGSIEGLSEDFSFCRRAQMAGYKIRVDTGLKIGHIGEIVVDESFAEKNRQFEWDAWDPIPPVTDGSPVVSVTIPTFNQREDYLKASILSALHQTVPVEVIVVDDGSTPPLRDRPEFMEWFNEQHEELAANEVPVSRLQLISYVKGDGSADCVNKGISAALNSGIRAMDPKVQYWCWLSSDDIFAPNKCQQQLAVITQMGAKASFTRWQALTEGNHYPQIAEFYAEKYPWSNIKEQMILLAQACVVNGSTVMLHRDIFSDIGMFDESIKYGQDWDMWCRIGICHFWAPVKDILVSRREGGNLTERIANDPQLKHARDREDDRIRSQYRSYLPRGT